VVYIHRVDQSKGRIHIGGLDLLDGTPVIDIKPYIPYTDSVAEATAGYAPQPDGLLNVEFSAGCERVCTDYYNRHHRDLRQLIEQVLRQDPRPAYHQDDRSYGMRLWNTNIRFTCTTTTITVNSIEENYHAQTT